MAPSAVPEPSQPGPLAAQEVLKPTKMPSQHPPGYDIPDKYRARLEEVAVTDTRSDEAIAAALKEHVPVTSEKNVWAFWHSGVDGMPGWSLRNVIGWVRMLGPSWTVRIIDTEPSSPNHFLRFIPAEMLPECFVRGTHHGKFRGQHSADFVRGPLVYLHGGLSLDVGCYLTRHIDRWCWAPLEDETSGVEVVIALFFGRQMANFFVASRKGNKWIKRWHDLLLEVWKGRDTHDGLTTHPLLHYTKGITFEESRKSGVAWEYVLEPREVIEYVTQVFCWIRMTLIQGNPDDPDDFDYAEYWRTKIRALNLHKEMQALDSLYGWHNAGPRHLQLLTQRVHPPQPDNPDWQEAHDLVWHLLAETTLQKISKGKNVLDERTLGTLWPENPGKDDEENTFAHLLRYGALHYRQTREKEVTMDCEPGKITVKRGLLEHPAEGELI